MGKVRRLTNGKTRWQGVILEIDAQKKAEHELQLYRNKLEKLVESRTEDLRVKTTELEEANKHLIEMDKLKSVFLASMSHELRTPLNSIIGFTGILLMGMVGELTDEQKYQLNIVKESASHLLALINDILDISKIEAGKVDLIYEDFQLDALIENVVLQLEPQVKAKALSIVKDVEAGMLMHSDNRRIRQIILNLVSNAVKLTDKGSVTIKKILISRSRLLILG